jgi:hypothetical protein
MKIWFPPINLWSKPKQMNDKIDMVEYCNALKETARQKESDNTDALSKQQLLSRIRKLEAENYILRKQLEDNS